MKKFDLLEKHIILTSIKNWETEMRKDIKEGGPNGRRHIWSESYLDLVMNRLYKKLHNHSKKDKNASRENS